jgi:hypothetical protein
MIFSKKTVNFILFVYHKMRNIFVLIFVQIFLDESLFLEKTTGHLVSINNILGAALLYQSYTRSLFILAFKVWTFLTQKYWRKCAHKMLVKLTPDRTFWPFDYLWLLCSTSFRYPFLSIRLHHDFREQQKWN